MELGLRVSTGILMDEQSGLLPRIAATESGSLYTPMKS